MSFTNIFVRSYEEDAVVGGTAASSAFAILYPEADGTNDRMFVSAGSAAIGSRISGNAVSMSLWFKAVGTGGDQQIIRVSGGQQTQNDTVYLDRGGLHNTNTGILWGGYEMYITNPASLANSEWNHLAIAISSNDASSQRIVVNDTTAVGINVAAATAGTFSFDGKWEIGYANLGSNINHLIGAFGQLWLTNEWVDWHDTATRRKVIDADLTPASAGVIGTSGENVTGTKPILFLGNHINSIEQNLGVLPDFTIEGAYTTANTIPIAASTGTPV